MQDVKKPGILRRIVMFCGTIIFLGIAAAVVSFGSGVLADRAEAVPSPDPAALIPVDVAPVAFDDHYTTTRAFLGQVEAAADAVMSFELAGRLAALSVDEGESVQKGDVIARLDTALLEAEQTRLIASRDATNAQLIFAETRLARAIQLQDQGFSSQETLDQARATRDELISRIAEIDAAMSSIEINLEKSVMRAPFDGRVAAQNVDITETLGPGQPVMTLVETSDPLMRVGIPLSLQEADLQTVRIDIAGQEYAATLRQLRPDIDPTTRTRTALFSLQTETAPTFGQTATLLVESTVQVKGVWVALDALQQGSGSIWTVLVVEDGIVRTAAVEVLYQQSDRAYVQGSFQEGALMITTGAHRVVPGQQVLVLQGGV